MSPDPSSADAVVHEHVLELAGHRTRVAITSMPPVPRVSPVVLLVNAGVIHRVGPHRLHVKLARGLAEAGHPAVRMDLSGVGDSDAIPDRLSFRESSVADIRATIDHVQAEGIATSAIVFGVCSGADNALAAAAADARIVGLVLVDPPCYATSQSKMRSLLARLRYADTWLEMPRRALARLRNRLSPDTGIAPTPPAGRQAPPIEDYRKQLTALVGRGVRVLSIYSGAVGVRYNHDDQLYEWFPELRGKLDVAYCPDANHTFTEVAQQSALISRVIGWCEQRFPTQADLVPVSA